MIVLSHPTGNANVREVARALAESDLLSEFWTTVSWRPDHPLNMLVPESVRRQLSRRAFSYVDRERVRCHPWRESGRLLGDKLGFSRLIRHETGWCSIDAVYRSLDKRVSRRLQEQTGIRAVYAYEDGAQDTFKAARELDIQTIYELPIGYWRPLRELMREEAELHPEWAPTLVGNTNSAEKHRRKDDELALATHVVVASTFALKTLSRATNTKAQVSVVPYGAPLIRPALSKPRPSTNKLRVIFVGSLSQRKGLGYLLTAVEIAGANVELTLIGKRSSECAVLGNALRKHRWIPSLSHAEVLEELRKHDVMVFPSLFEGFGLVILEAMSCGVPVVTTPNGAGPDVISDGEDGFIVPIRDSEAIAEKLDLLMVDRKRLAAMGRAASEKARKHSWEAYRKKVVTVMKQTIEPEFGPDGNDSNEPQLLACNS